MSKLFAKQAVLTGLLLLFGAKASATVATWDGSTSVTVSGTNTDWNAIASTGVQVSSQSGGTNLTSNYRSGDYYDLQFGFKSGVGAKGYIRATADLSVEIAFSAAPSVGQSTTLTVDGHPYTLNKTSVTTVFLDMTAGTAYELTANVAFVIRSVTSYTADELVVFDDTQSKASNEALLSNTGKSRVKLKRTLQAGIWNTLCLPVNLSAANLQKQLGVSNVYEMDGFSDNTITFKAATSITRFKPYLIKPENIVVNPILTGSNNLTSNGLATNSTVTSGDLSFVSVLGSENIYTTGDDTSTKFYLNTKGDLVYPTSNSGNNGTIKGLRAYFEWVGGGSVKDFGIAFDDDPTGIYSLQKDIFSENGNIYTLDGRYMGSDETRLAPGLYIKNGRKFSVK